MDSVGFDTTTITGSDNLGWSIWFWVSILEFLLLALFLSIILRLRRQLKKEIASKEEDDEFRYLDKDKIASDTVDYDKLMRSIAMSKELYKQLIVKYHPDRFLDPIKKSHAERLSQQITENKKRYDELLELQDEAKRLLG